MLALADCLDGAHHVIVRVDMNVPMDGGRVVDDQRIRASLPTIRHSLSAGCATTVLSHLGRPREGQFDKRLSLRPVAQRLGELLGEEVRFAESYLDGLAARRGETVVCENVRFNTGEKANDEGLSRALARLGDLFVMDAFACAHRSHASTHGAIVYAKQACSGMLLNKELSDLTAIIDRWRKPVVAIIGGAKISSKFKTLEALMMKVDELVPVGGMANTLLASCGYSLGRSLVEKDWLPSAQRLQRMTEQGGAQLFMLSDVVCAGDIDAPSGTQRLVDKVRHNEMILDIGHDSIHRLCQSIARAGTVLWSGPAGVFENPAFAKGTQMIAHAIADASADSAVGGGDTLAALARFDSCSGISHISTGGSAFLHFIEGRELPALAALERRQGINV